jgi:hypothetical protein
MTKYGILLLSHLHFLTSVLGSLLIYFMNREEGSFQEIMRIDDREATTNS